MSIEITNLGINSIANAATGGFKIDVASFKLTEAPISGPDATLHDVTGVPVYSGTIETIEVISANAVRCWIVIPPGIPTNVPSWSLSEIGIYLTSGALFAHGKLQPVYEKSADFGIRVQVILTAVKLGNVINISLSGLASVPAVAHVYQLPNPTDYPYAVVSVGDAQYNPDRTNSPCTAFKYGDGDASWGFTDHDSVYSGIVYTASSTQIQVENASNGFKLDKDEVVIANFYFGGGYGQTRRYRFDGVKTFYELDGKPVVGAGPTSYVRLWRSNSNNRVNVLSTPSVLRSQFVTNGATDTFPLPIAPISADYALPFLAGKLQSGFTVNGNNLKLPAIPAANQNLEVCIIRLLPSLTESGTILEWKEFEYVGNGVDSQWPIDFQPENIEHVFLFYDGIKQIPGSNYTLGNQHVDSNAIVPNGVKVNLAILKRKASKNNNLVIRRKDWSGVSHASSVVIYQAQDTDVLGSVGVWLSGLHVPDSGHSENGKNVAFTTSISGNVSVIELRPALQFDVADRPINSLSITTDNKLKVTRTNGETYQLELPKQPFITVANGQSYGPSSYPDNTLTGFDAYASPNMPKPNFISGWTVMNQGRGAQMAVGWNGEAGNPIGAWLRIKDDTQGNWGTWRELAFVDMLPNDGNTSSSATITQTSVFTAPVTGQYNIKTIGGGGAGKPATWQSGSNSGTLIVSPHASLYGGSYTSQIPNTSMASGYLSATINLSTAQAVTFNFNVQNISATLVNPNSGSSVGSPSQLSIGLFIDSTFVSMIPSTSTVTSASQGGAGAPSVANLDIDVLGSKTVSLSAGSHSIVLALVDTSPTDGTFGSSSMNCVNHTTYSSGGSIKAAGLPGNTGAVVSQIVNLTAGQQVNCIVGAGGIDPTDPADTYYYSLNTGLNQVTSGNGGFTSFGSFATALGGNYGGGTPTNTESYGKGGAGGIPNTINAGSDPGSRGTQGAIIITW